MSRIRSRRRQDDFGVRRQLDLSHSCSEIRDRHSAHFGVVRRRNHDFKHGRDCAIAPPDLDVIFGKNDLIGIWFDAAWLVRSRPNLAGGFIAQENVRSPGVTCTIFPPSCNRKVAPAAVTGTRRSDHH
jgi:hypothetical protein